MPSRRVIDGWWECPAMMTATSARRASQGLQIVDDEQARAVDLHDLPLPQRPRPAAVVVVASHGDDRRDAAERLEHLRRPDVARVQDERTPAQRAHGLRTQQPVRVGDDTDPRAL